MFCFVIGLDDNEGFQTACTIKLSNLRSMSSSAKCGLNKQFNKSYMIISTNIYTIIGLVLTICLLKKFQSKSLVDLTKILYVMYNTKY